MGILVIAAGEKNSNAEVLRSRLEVIKNMFITAYELKPDFAKKGLVNVQKFTDFAVTLDMLREQWKQAEKAMGAAALFDMLGIFQQIFNIFIQLVKNNFFGQKYEDVINEIKRYKTEFDKNPEMINNTEFQNLMFDEQMGWNVITLNPLMLEEDVLTTMLFRITRYMKNVIMNHLGYMVAFNSFSKEILPYIFNNWELIEKIGLTKRLLEIFIERPSKIH
jgi:hypothetical protein